MLHVYLDEPCPLDGYGDLTVRVLANATWTEWRRWLEGGLGDPGCAACEMGPPRVYCDDCTARRQAFGQSIVLFYGPRLLDHDLTTPEQALALFDDDDALPSEIVTWLLLAPRLIRERREKELLGNLTGS
jgi:hypothetical protein